MSDASDAAPDSVLARPAVHVAVVMEREARPNRWEDWRFRLAEVVPAEPAFGAEPRVLRDDGKLRRTLYPNFKLELFVDECKGYYLNLTSGNPVWFVMWRIDDADAGVVHPEAVSLSYIEADRWLSAEEQVDNVPLPAEVRDWLLAFTNDHFKPQAEKRRKPQSFLSPEDRAKS